MILVSVPGLSNEMFERVPNIVSPCLPEDIDYNQYRSLTRICVQLFSPNQQRGLFQTGDGGQTITRTLRVELDPRVDVKQAELITLPDYETQRLNQAENEWKGIR